MANWAGAVETFGKGLFAVGMKMTQREDDEIAFMRQKALQELGIQAQKDLQAANHAYLDKAREDEQIAAAEGRAVEIAARRGDVEAAAQHARELNEDNKQWDLKRDSAMKDFQLKLREQDRQEDIIRFTNTQLADIGKSIDTWEQEMLSYDGGDPAVVERYQRRIESLYAQQQQVREAGQAQLSRMTGGKPVQPGPTKEAAAALGGPRAEPAAAPPKADGTGRAGEYTGGKGAPKAEQATLFDQVEPKRPFGDWAYNSVEDTNKALFGAGGAIERPFVAGGSATTRINRQLAAKLRGMTLEQYEAELARQGQ